MTETIQRVRSAGHPAVRSAVRPTRVLHRVLWRVLHRALRIGERPAFPFVKSFAEIGRC
jgi:hypothetical protein